MGVHVCYRLPVYVSTVDNINSAAHSILHPFLQNLHIQLRAPALTHTCIIYKYVYLCHNLHVYLHTTRRQDQIGTPLCITVDPATAEDGCVTIRDRDSMLQCRMHAEELKDRARDGSIFEAVKQAVHA